jgi:hypothetical protein
LFSSFQWFEWLETSTGNTRFGERTGRTLGSVGFVENVKKQIAARRFMLQWRSPIKIVKRSCERERENYPPRI